ncbi:MAG: histidine triad nucleotide-binding protein [Frankiales bacterium]|nr:histidine triad nucleotide-binding protein [Frankiales bacterium]
MTDPSCIFCRIVAGEIPSTQVAETDRTLAFRDLSPAAPVHVLVVPKQHHPDLATLSDADPGLLADLWAAAVAVARSEGLEAGYRLVVNTGADGGQTVFHVHVHVLGGGPVGALA